MSILGYSKGPSVGFGLATSQSADGDAGEELIRKTGGEDGEDSGDNSDGDDSHSRSR